MRITISGKPGAGKSLLAAMIHRMLDTIDVVVAREGVTTDTYDRFTAMPSDELAAIAETVITQVTIVEKTTGRKPKRKQHSETYEKDPLLDDSWYDGIGW